MHTTCAPLVALFCLAWSIPAGAACYQLFDKKDRLVLQSTSAPVDLSQSISDEVGRRYPGHYLVVGGSGPCPEVDELNKVESKLPAESLNRGPIRLSGDAAARQRQVASPNRTAPTKPLPMFKNCKEAKAAGATPIRAGEPGYGPHLDKDGDGVACEPSSWRR